MPPLEAGLERCHVDAGLSALNTRVNRVEQGVALATAVQNPVLTGSSPGSASP